MTTDELDEEKQEALNHILDTTSTEYDLSMGLVGIIQGLYAVAKEIRDLRQELRDRPVN